jgi:sec-independent protein translocase protein TatC
MSLMEHIQELRSRLFKACLGILVGMIAGYYLANRTLDFLTSPYCRLHPGEECNFSSPGVASPFLVTLQIALYLGLLFSAPIWLYQLWAFIAPGLHRRERRYTYGFVGVAVPLFVAGAALANFIVSKTLHFLLNSAGEYKIVVNLDGYVEFVVKMMLLFGAGFEFPLIVVMLNFAGVVSARRLLSWWRPAIFLMFLFGAIVTPTPDPFGMSALAGAMALLYFAAVGVAFLNDRRRERRRVAEFGPVSDDEASPLTNDVDPVEAGERIEAIDPVAPPTPVSQPEPIDHRYDDTT